MRELSATVGSVLRPYQAYLGPIDSDRLLLTTTFTVTHTITYSFMLSFFVFLDWSGRCQHWRLHEKSVRPPRALLVEAAFNTLANHSLLQMLSTYYLAAPVFAAAGALDSFAAAEAPGVMQTLAHFALCIVIHDTAFYWTHRMMHTPLLYRTVHKRHHAFSVNHAIAVEHAHVVESIVANLFPMFLPCVLLKVHGTTFMLWFSAMLAEGSDAHSGFALPYSPFRLFRQTERHAFHHSHCGGAEGLGTSGCYGGWLHFWDWACGTDGAFLEHVERGTRPGRLSRRRPAGGPTRNSGAKSANRNFAELRGAASPSVVAGSTATDIH